MTSGIVKGKPWHESQVHSKTTQNIAGEFSQTAVLTANLLILVICAILNVNHSTTGLTRSKRVPGCLFVTICGRDLAMSVL
jgi:hypothetical protein